MTTVEPAPAAGQPPALLIAGTAVALAVALTLLGALGWPSPERTLSGWQVADVPASTSALVSAAALVCLTVAALLARPAGWRAPVGAAVWWALAVASAFAGAWNDLFFAALATSGDGAVIPVFDGFFTFTPALVAALVTIPQGRVVQLRAGLSTAVVSLPLLALSWALYGAPAGFGRAVTGTLLTTGFFGVLPLAVALALTVPLNPRRGPALAH